MCAMWIPGRVGQEGERTERWKAGGMVSKIECKLYTALCSFREAMGLGEKKHWSATISSVSNLIILSSANTPSAAHYRCYWAWSARSLPHLSSALPQLCARWSQTCLSGCCPLLLDRLSITILQWAESARRARTRNAWKHRTVGTGTLALHQFAAVARKSTSAGHGLSAGPEA